MKGFGGMQQMLRQANQMQSKMKKFKEEFDQKLFTGSAGGGAVEVQIFGSYVVQEIKIDSDVMGENDPEMLQDLIKTATNTALEELKIDHEKSMSKITGGMNIPGMM